MNFICPFKSRFALKKFKGTAVQVRNHKSLFFLSLFALSVFLW